MNTELMTDDEALRMQGMIDGPKKIAGITLRPITAESFLLMEGLVFSDDEIGDSLKMAAYVYLHSENEEDILAVAFSKKQFWPAVTKWVGAKFKHHIELNPYGEELADSIERYKASISSASSKSDALAGPKN